MLRKDTFIINLGAIVSPNIQLAIDSYVDLITKKSGADINVVKKQIGGVLFAKIGVINQFKDGVLDEDKFNEQMIAALKEATGVELTVEEFDDCWHKQHPTYEAFAEPLQQAIDYAKKSDKKIVFISHTNPKDMRNLIAELALHKIPFKAINLQLSEIDGIELHLTYIEHKSQDIMITDLIKIINSGGPTSLVNSMRSIFSSDDSYMPPHIVYISTPNNIKELTLKADLDKTMSDIEKMARRYGIDCIVWNKSDQSLEKILKGLEISYKSAASL